MNKNILDRLLGGLIWTVGSRIVGIFSGVMVSGLLARVLTPNDLGSYYLAISLITFMVTLSTFGIPVLVVRGIAKAIAMNDLSQARETVFSAFKVVFVLSGVVFIAFNLGAGGWLAEYVFHSQPLFHVVFIMSLLIFLKAFHSLAAEIFRGFHDIRLASIFSGVIVSIFTMFFLWVAREFYGTLDLAQVLNLVFLACILGFLLTIPFLIVKIARLNQGRPVEVKDLLFSGWSIVVMNLTVLGASQGVLWWLAGVNISKDEIAVYGTVLQLIAMLMLSHSLLISVAQSTMAELKAKNDFQKLEKLVQGMSSITFLVVLMGVCVFIIWGKDILGMIYGDYYVSGYLLLILVSCFYLIGSLFGASGMLLMMTGHEKILMKIVVITMGFRFAFAALLGNEYGLYSVAIAWGVGGLIQNVWVWLTVRKVVGIRSHANFDFTMIIKRLLS